MSWVGSFVWLLRGKIWSVPTAWPRKPTGFPRTSLSMCGSPGIPTSICGMVFVQIHPCSSSLYPLSGRVREKRDIARK